jgi:glucokinase
MRPNLKSQPESKWNEHCQTTDAETFHFPPPTSNCAEGAMNTVGIDVGGTFIKGVRWSTSLQAERQVLKPADASGWLAAARELILELKTFETSAVGVGLAGLVRWPEGEFTWGPHVAGEALGIKSILEEALELPVVVDNDANCAALAELSIGSAQGARHMVMLTFGTGIGAGIIADGKVYRGASFAGEAGHITMVPGGELCACGRRGCWETLVSGRRLDREAGTLVESEPDGVLAKLIEGHAPKGAHLALAADAGDGSARDILAEAGRWLARGVANLVALLDPEVVVVGGAAAQAGRWLLDPARQELELVLEGAEYRKPPPLVTASAGPLAGAIGAALLATEARGSERGVRSF